MKVFESNDLNLTKIKDGVFYMKNFYKDPVGLVALLSTLPIHMHKENEKNSLNGKMFLDGRHSFFDSSLIETEKKLKSFFNTNTKTTGNFHSNVFRMLDKSYNNFKDNFWYPHKDEEDYVCLVYFNDPGCDGTNIYQDTSFQPQTNEHEQPWIDKKNYELDVTYKPEFNDLFIFPGKVLHGMNMCSDRFFSEDRINQVIFL